MDAYTKKIVNFMAHCENDVLKFLDNYSYKEHDGKHDIFVTVNGKTLQIELCAEVHHAFMDFLKKVKMDSEE